MSRTSLFLACVSVVVTACSSTATPATEDSPTTPSPVGWYPSADEASAQTITFQLTNESGETRWLLNEGDGCGVMGIAPAGGKLALRLSGRHSCDFCGCETRRIREPVTPIGRVPAIAAS